MPACTFGDMNEDFEDFLGLCKTGRSPRSGLEPRELVLAAKEHINDGDEEGRTGLFHASAEGTIALFLSLQVAMQLRLANRIEVIEPSIKRSINAQLVKH